MGLSWGPPHPGSNKGQGVSCNSLCGAVFGLIQSREGDMRLLATAQDHLCEREVLFSSCVHLCYLVLLSIDGWMEGELGSLQQPRGKALPKSQELQPDPPVLAAPDREPRGKDTAEPGGAGGQTSALGYQQPCSQAINAVSAGGFWGNELPRGLVTPGGLGMAGETEALGTVLAG